MPMMEVDESRTVMKREELYPFDVFRFPSLGMLACPPEVPAEIFGMQLCFAMANNAPFLNWGPPGITCKTAMIDFTASDYNILKIRASLVKYYEKLAADVAPDQGRPQKIESPRLFGYDCSKSECEFMREDNDAYIDYLSKLIDDGYDFIYVHGISGFYDKSFYNCVSRMKRLTVDKFACMIVNHVIASVVYNKDSEGALRGPLSHAMIRESHQEATAIMDWVWFVAPTTQGIIQSVSGSGISNMPAAGASLFANKIVWPNRHVSLGQSRRDMHSPVNGLFYLYKSSAPILFSIQLKGTK